MDYLMMNPTNATLKYNSMYSNEDFCFDHFTDPSVKYKLISIGAFL